jgi:hypothetical protein
MRTSTRGMKRGSSSALSRGQSQAQTRQRTQEDAQSQDQPASPSGPSSASSTSLLSTLAPAVDVLRSPNAEDLALWNMLDGEMHRSRAPMHPQRVPQNAIVRRSVFELITGVRDTIGHVWYCYAYAAVPLMQELDFDAMRSAAIVTCSHLWFIATTQNLPASLETLAKISAVRGFLHGNARNLLHAQGGKDLEALAREVDAEYKRVREHEAKMLAQEARLAELDNESKRIKMEMQRIREEMMREEAQFRPHDASTSAFPPPPLPPPLQAQQMISADDMPDDPFLMPAPPVTPTPTSALALVGPSPQLSSKALTPYSASKFSTSSAPDQIDLGGGLRDESAAPTPRGVAPSIDDADETQQIEALALRSKYVTGAAESSARITISTAGFVKKEPGKQLHNVDYAAEQIAAETAPV